jgi:3-methylfumaryl-CoA hydratase
MTATAERDLASTLLANCVGRTRETADCVRSELLERVAATLGVPTPDALPLTWHWCLFQDWVAPEGLGPDGHPRRGGFLPPVYDLPRRMWAGGEVEAVAPIRPGDRVTRRSRIASAVEKAGGSGRLVFVEVHHEIAGPAGVALRERQTLVYRGTDGAAVREAPAAPPAPPGAAEFAVMPDPVLLFRYSALTGNGHRIHYDADYVRDAEGYPGLVVHGPLQATLLAGLAEQANRGRLLARLRFRGARPAFAGAVLRGQGWAEADRFALRTLDPSGRVCMEADAWFS